MGGILTDWQCLCALGKSRDSFRNFVYIVTCVYEFVIVGEKCSYCLTDTSYDCVAALVRECILYLK